MIFFWCVFVFVALAASGREIKPIAPSPPNDGVEFLTQRERSGWDERLLVEKYQTDDRGDIVKVESVTPDLPISDLGQEIGAVMSKLDPHNSMSQPSEAEDGRDHLLDWLPQNKLTFIDVNGTEGVAFFMKDWSHWVTFYTCMGAVMSAFLTVLGLCCCCYFPNTAVLLSVHQQPPQQAPSKKGY
eukprot:GHVN01091179.1.p1 GENE.GHVN01091179.1~~GHVN01091179.1.p1  ORF type:complete len:185 (-),score=26.88 GHVN01091179.1:696-1250(-)